MRSAFTLFLFVALMSASSCAIFSREPEIIQGLPNDTIGNHNAFWDRVKKAFPENMEARVLVEELEEQGFEVNGQTAIYKSSGFVWTRQWTITWDEHEGRAQNIKAEHFGVSL